MNTPHPFFEESALGTEQHVVSYLSEEQSHHCLEALPEGWYVGFLSPMINGFPSGVQLDKWVWYIR